GRERLVIITGERDDLGNAQPAFLKAFDHQSGQDVRSSGNRSRTALRRQIQPEIQSILDTGFRTPYAENTLRVYDGSGIPQRLLIGALPHPIVVRPVAAQKCYSP